MRVKRAKTLSAAGITLALSLAFVAVPAASAAPTPGDSSDVTDSKIDADEGAGATTEALPEPPGLQADSTSIADDLRAATAGKGSRSSDNSPFTNAADYFEAVGATDAHLILTDADYTRHFAAIQLGNPDSATSLPNLLLALDYIDEANDLRDGEGQSPLLVGDSLMAAAMANADYIREVWGHPQQWGGLAENIAAGFSGPPFSDNSPFVGWYDDEKVIWNDALESGDYPGLEDMSIYQVYVAYPALYYAVGHYLNLMDQSNVVTGFGVYTSEYPYYAQEFTGSAGGFTSGNNGEYLTPGRILSVEKYRESVLAYAKESAIAFEEVPTPVITGYLKVGSTLTATKAGKENYKPTADTVTYQWLRNGQEISGATERTYTLTAEDADQKISVQATGEALQIEAATTTSKAVQVALGTFTTIPKPVVSGSAQVGSTLTATKAEEDDFEPTADTVTYQWLRNGQEISGATERTYTLTAEDAERKIAVRVTGTKTGYVTASQTSAAKTIAAMPPNSPDVTRLAGSNRYGTNRAVNTDFGVAYGPVFVATGADFADALSIGPVVRITGGTLFLTGRTSIDQATLDQIRALAPSDVYIVGGPGAVSAQVASKVGAAAGQSTTRVSGANRYETSEAIYKKFFVDTVRPVHTAFVATGRDFPDALSSASAGAALSAPVLLVDGTKTTGLSSYLTQSLQSKGTSRVLISGGTGAVNSSIEAKLKRSFSTTRLHGANRYATNMAINNYVANNAGSIALTDVWIATGRDFPDALSAAAPSGQLSSRLVLSGGTCIPKPVVSEWITPQTSKVENVWLAGGTGVLSQSVKNLTQCQ